MGFWTATGSLLGPFDSDSAILEELGYGVGGDTVVRGEVEEEGKISFWRAALSGRFLARVELELAREIYYDRARPQLHSSLAPLN